MKCLIATLSASLALALPAQAYMAQNTLVVKPVGGDRFEVPFRGLSGAGHFWCAAGDYVVVGLGLPTSTRIYRVSSPPRRSGQGVTFSLSPEGATATGIITLFGDRKSLSAANARHYCDTMELLGD